MAFVGTLPRQQGGAWGRLLWLWVQLPLHTIVQYGPVLGLALPAAFASAQFSMHHNIFPAPLAWAIGISFEWVYLGSFAVAASLKESVWFKAVNGVAVTVSILFVTLYAADRYGLLETLLQSDWGIFFKWLFAVVHAAPLAGLNWIYNNLIHQYQREMKEDEAKTQYKCPICSRGFATENALNGHMRVH